MIKKIIGHTKTVIKHRWIVFKFACKIGIPWRGFVHDLSKFSPTEFGESIKYYVGVHSPITEAKKSKGYSDAWLHHKGRNKHHLEYWIDYDPTRQKLLAGAKMPVKYVVEMYCDRVAACKIYHKEAYSDSSALEYFDKGRSKELMHPESAALLRDMLSYLAEHGEKATSLYIRKEILHNKR